MSIHVTVLNMQHAEVLRANVMWKVQDYWKIASTQIDEVLSEVSISLK